MVTSLLGDGIGVDFHRRVEKQLGFRDAPRDGMKSR